MLLTQTQILWLHATPAFLALILGIVILASKKGTKTHKFRGYAWLGVMLVVVISSFFIEELNPGSFTAIHLFIPVTVFGMVSGTYYIKKYQATGNRGWIVAHKYTMISMVIGGIGLAGALSLIPGRIIHGLLFG